MKNQRFFLDALTFVVVQPSWLLITQKGKTLVAYVSRLAI
jgi:hypothetical protein